MVVPGSSGSKVKKTPFEIDLASLTKNHKEALDKLKWAQIIEIKSQEEVDALLIKEETDFLQSKWKLLKKHKKDKTELEGEMLDDMLKNSISISNGDLVSSTTFSVISSNFFCVSNNNSELVLKSSVPFSALL